ncbi:MAG TPA: polysaccharide deacetylase family protein [Thermaerobacter sp.]
MHRADPLRTSHDRGRDRRPPAGQDAAATTRIMLMAALVVLAALAGWRVGLMLDARAATGAAGPAWNPRTALAAAPVHVVRPGETLFRIARRYGLSVDELARYNRIADPTRIKAGQRLRIPPGAGQEGAAQGRVAGPNAGAGTHGTGRPGSPPAGPEHGNPGSGGDGDGGGKQDPGAAQGGIVALTFNDGPDPAVWPDLLAALERAHARATFFIEGARARAHPELVRELARRGHQVENHGWSHEEPASPDERQARAAIRRTAVLIEELTGRRPLYYRPPGGLRDPAVFRWAEAEGHRVLLWTNIGVPDVPPPPAGQLASRLSDHAYNGAILMLHATQRRTVEELPAILDALRKRGLRPVTVDQLMEALSRAAGAAPEAGAPAGDQPAAENKNGTPAGQSAENKKEG